MPKLTGGIHTCVVRGEKVSSPGSFSDVERGRIDLERCIPYDGCHTDIGVVCERCLPVYEAAFDIHALGPEPLSPKALRKAIQGTLRDSEFVAGFLREQARAKIAQVVDGLKFPMSKAAVLRLEELLTSGIGQNNRETVGHIQEQMEALGIKGLCVSKARACLKEEERTSKFLEALFVRLSQLEESRDSIEMIDAGCGPIPIFGLMAALKSAKTRVTCLESNPASAEIATDIIEYFGLSDRVKVIETDATEYQHGRPVDLLISETMYTGLTGEPLIQILQNLAPQVRPDGVIIPEWVTVEAGIISASQRNNAEDIPSIPLATGETEVLDGFFAVQPHEVVRFTREQLHNTVDFTIELNPDLPDDEYTVTIGSRVGLADEIVLEGYASTITAPKPLAPSFKKAPDEPTKSVHVSYVPGTSRADVTTRTIPFQSAHGELPPA